MFADNYTQNLNSELLINVLGVLKLLMKNECAYQLFCTTLKEKGKIQNFLSLFCYALNNNDHGINCIMLFSSNVINLSVYFSLLDLCTVFLDFLKTAMQVSLSENNEYNQFIYLLDTTVVDVQPLHSFQRKENRKSNGANAIFASQQLFVLLAELFDTIKGTVIVEFCEL